MKIDLHCHTKAIKKGDGSGRNVTPELFKEKIETADIKIIAITNHNAFDLNQYKPLVKDLANDLKKSPRNILRTNISFSSFISLIITL